MYFPNFHYSSNVMEQTVLRTEISNQKRVKWERLKYRPCNAYCNLKRPYSLYSRKNETRLLKSRMNDEIYSLNFFK